MEWLSNLGASITTTHILLLIVIIYLNSIRTDLGAVKDEIQRFRIQWLKHTNYSGEDI